MHRTRSILIVFVLCAAVTWAHLAADVPLFAWSGESFLDGTNTAVPSALTTTDFESLLDAILHGRNLPSTFSSKQRAVKPELVVLFVEPHLRFDQIAAHANNLANLKTAMQSEASSLYAPYMDLHASSRSISTLIVNAAVVAHANGASIIYAGRGSDLLPALKRRVSSTQAVTIAKLAEHLANSAIFNNGVTDLLIVHLDNGITDLSKKFAKSDSIIKSVQDALKTKSYLSLYTALSYDDPTWASEFDDTSKRFIVEADFFMELANNVTNGTQPSWFQIFWPGWFWEVALVVVIILPIIIMGFCLLLSIQVPENVIPQSKSKQHKKLH